MYAYFNYSSPKSGCSCDKSGIYEVTKERIDALNKLACDISEDYSNYLVMSIWNDNLNMVEFYIEGPWKCWSSTPWES